MVVDIVNHIVYRKCTVGEKKNSSRADELGDVLGFGHADLTERVADAMRSVSRAYVEIVVATLGRYGFDNLTVATATLLASLPERGIKVADLARVTGRTKQAAGKLIADLEENGYVTRIPDADDGRSFLVHPTVKGQEVLLRGAAIKDSLAVRAVEALGPQALQRLYRDLATLEVTFTEFLQT